MLAIDAPHHHRTLGAPSLEHARGLGVSVADSWTGDTIAALLGRLIARVGRPAASLTDAGSAWQKAVALLHEKGRASPCLDAISHAAAGMRTRDDHHHPAFEPCVSAGGRVSGTLKHTILACVAPPTVRTTARFLPVHRLCPWAERLRKRSPAGAAKRGST